MNVYHIWVFCKLGANSYTFGTHISILIVFLSTDTLKWPQDLLKHAGVNNMELNIFISMHFVGIWMIRDSVMHGYGTCTEIRLHSCSDEKSRKKLAGSIRDIAIAGNMDDCHNWTVRVLSDYGMQVNSHIDCSNILVTGVKAVSIYEGNARVALCGPTPAVDPWAIGQSRAFSVAVGTSCAVLSAVYVGWRRQISVKNGLFLERRLWISRNKRRLGHNFCILTFNRANHKGVWRYSVICKKCDLWWRFWIHFEVFALDRLGNAKFQFQWDRTSNMWLR
jgi:hypothetical protein